MLDDLDKVEWGKLTHAYGEASDVPELLRALAADDKERRDKAMWELYGNIWHQGTVYEATAYAVPFLIRLAQAESVADRDQILVYLTYLARGNSYLDVHQEMDLFKELYKERMQTAEYEQEVETELGWVRAATRAVVQGVDTYVSLLDDKEAAVRTAAAYTLARLRAATPEIRNALHARYAKETDELVRASIIMSLGVLGQADGEGAWLRELLAQAGEKDLQRLAAAMALIWRERGAAPDAAIISLTDMIEDPRLVEDLYAKLPWNQDGIVADASQHLCLLGREHAERVVPLILAIFGSLSLWPATSVVGALFYLTFTPPRKRTKLKAADLTPLQRQILTALVDNEGIWQSGNMTMMLADYGVPDKRDELARFLG